MTWSPGGLAPASDFPGSRVSDFLYDGIADPGSTATGENKMQICFKGNTTSPGFANLHMDQLKQDGSNLADIMTFSATAFDCSLPALPAVTF